MTRLPGNIEEESPGVEHPTVQHERSNLSVGAGVPGRDLLAGVHLSQILPSDPADRRE